MERIAKKSHGFGEAEAWDIQQQLAMTPAERLRAARAIKDRLYPGKRPDVRQCHQRPQAR